ncbi:uncharacterized protein LOC141696552 [Apium graveolens]|uniref:uncharacterized protein LOC141696552 n=1 Tax=Apium graveolens TaxID=4045 RepID=UPI003D7BDF33
MGEVDEDDDDFSSDSSDFINHVEAEHEPLYPGCENYSKMKALVKLFNLKVKHEMSDSCFSDVLLLIGYLLPDGNNIPSSFNEAKKTLCALGMGYEKIHACPNNCLLYRGQIDEDEATCGNVIKGYNACTVCVDNTKATSLVHYRKAVIMRHKRWLPRHHPYRKQKSAFDNTVEKSVAPIPLTGEQVLGRVHYLRDHVFGKTHRQPRWKKGDARPVWKKVSIFFQLEYWKFFPVSRVLDVMHIEKNICESLLGTLLNIPGKTKDRESVRLDMDDMGIRTELRPKTPGKKEKVPLASWNLSNAEKKVVCSSFLQMKLPDGFCSNIKNLVNMEKLRLVGMKSHDCHTILHQLLPISIRRLRDMYATLLIPKAEVYVAEEAVECLVNFEEATIGFPKKGKDEENGITRPLSGATIIKPSNEDLKHAHICFLQNSNDIRPYFDEHMTSLMERYPQHENDQVWLKNKQNDQFPEWFKKKIETELLHDHNGITDEIRWIAEGPNKNVPTLSGYRINGVSYSTNDRDDNRQVQCSGVSVVADTLMLVEKDNTVEHTAQTYYGVITSIWELDYNKFKVPIFYCNWVDINKGVKVDDLRFILVNLNKLGFVNDPFVLGKHVKQVFYIDDPLEKFRSVVLKIPEKNLHDHYDEENDGSVEIELENELQTPMFPNVDEHDEKASYMREEEEWIQLP